MQFAVAILAAVGAVTAYNPPDPHWCDIALPADNYVAGPDIFPGAVLKAYNAPIGNWPDGGAWKHHVMMKCIHTTGCTGAVSYEVTNSSGPSWVGYTFNGGSMYPGNFTANSDSSQAVSQSHATTTVHNRNMCPKAGIQFMNQTAATS